MKFLVRHRLLRQKRSTSLASLVGDEEDDEDGDEDVSPIDEFVDEASVPADNEDIQMNWYILKVQVNRERTICEQLKRRVSVGGLDRYFGDIVVPTEDVREFNKAGKQRVVKRKLYPGYVVVNMAINDESWFLVRETSGMQPADLLKKRTVKRRSRQRFRLPLVNEFALRKGISKITKATFRPSTNGTVALR